VPTVPPGYPHAREDDEILQAVTTLVGELQSAAFSINAVMQYSPLVAAGQSELQARQAQRALTELQRGIDTFRASADTSSRWLVVLTCALVVLTVVLTGATIALLVKG
jgi:hypothetical protein